MSFRGFGRRSSRTWRSSLRSRWDVHPGRGAGREDVGRQEGPLRSPWTSSLGPRLVPDPTDSDRTSVSGSGRGSLEDHDGFGEVPVVSVWSGV